MFQGGLEHLPRLQDLTLHSVGISWKESVSATLTGLNMVGAKMLPM